MYNCQKCGSKLKSIITDYNPLYDPCEEMNILKYYECERCNRKFNIYFNELTFHEVRQIEYKIIKLLKYPRKILMDFAKKGGLKNYRGLQKFQLIERLAPF